LIYTWGAGKSGNEECNFRFFPSGMYLRSGTNTPYQEEIQTMILQPSKVVIPEPLVISELQVGRTISGWLLAVEVQMRPAKSGKLYLHLKLRDQRGNEIIARQFDPPSMEARSPQAGKVVLLEGVAEEFQNKLNIRLSRAELDEAAPADLFILGTRQPIEHLEAEFHLLMSKVAYPGLSELLQCCFTPEVIAHFRKWPAAVQHHGAVVGGLLEHTVNVATIAYEFTQLYSCDQNLVLAGALLHDIGKLEELEEQVGAGFTPMGRLVGHIILGMQYVQEQAQQVWELDEVIRDDLLHIILAHHGKKEFGSPIPPATIEALIVHQADAAEAALTGFLDHCERTSGPDGWSAYSQTFGRQLRAPEV